MYLTPKQVETLLKPIAANRVLTLSKGKQSLSYVAQHDVRAHLNRIFGFGRWSMDVKETTFIFEEQNDAKRWLAGYRATVRITIYAADGTEIAHYEDSHASSNAPQPDRGEAHALALTIAVSTAMKRAASSLGDQFGLSLYNKGQRSAFVRSLVLSTDDFDAAMSEVKIDGLGDEVSDKTLVEDDLSTVERKGTPAYTYDGAMAGAADDITGPDAGAPDEPATPADEPREVYRENALGVLRAIAMLASAGERILQTAKWKRDYADLLDDTTDVKGQQVTLGLLADRVAAGQMSPKTEA